MSINIDMPVGQLVAQHPAAARIFAHYQIDFCCGGGTPLRVVCEERQLDAAALIAAIAAAKTPAQEPDWAAMSVAEMCDAIERRYHVPLEDELPRLLRLAEKVARVHGDRHPAFKELAVVYAALSAELQHHMMKEEQVLFPMIRAHGHAPLPPIRVMRHEHDEAGAALRRIRELTQSYTPPEDGCNSVRALFHGLAELERELHLHIHVENNILFSRASATM